QQLHVPQAQGVQQVERRGVEDLAHGDLPRGGQPPGHGQPAQSHGEDELQQQADEEHGVAYPRIAMIRSTASGHRSRVRAAIMPSGTPSSSATTSEYMT